MLDNLFCKLKSQSDPFSNKGSILVDENRYKTFCVRQVGLLSTALVDS